MRVHKSQAVASVLSHMNPIYNLTTTLFLILADAPQRGEVIFTFRFPPAVAYPVLPAYAVLLLYKFIVLIFGEEYKL
jgi:hypothetical protein